MKHHGLLTIALGVILWGCGSTTLLSESGMRAEASAEAASISWPPGASVAWPVAPSSPTLYQPGVGTTEVDFAWACAWSKEWIVASTTDPARAENALRQLDGFKDLPVWSRWDEAGRNLTLDAISRARLGDPAPMQRLRSILACNP